ncbi:FtsB family cell division protein [Bifidobacterium aquikefiri]|uniref:FtsB family cell division protein n=1 Tax=Bifidobacterium aquikefiri TaxID=1653207 RepID=UPI0039E7BA33
MSKTSKGGGRISTGKAGRQHRASNSDDSKVYSHQFSATSKKSERHHTLRSSQRSSTRTLGNSGPISFFIAMIIILLGTVELVSTFHTYAINLSELNGLRKQEASLVAQKKDLENQISRWNDKAYVTAQARERLGFVFPGEEAVRVLHPEDVTGTKTNKNAKQEDSSSDAATLPWYSELAYAFNKANKQAGKSSGDTLSSSQSSTEPSTGSSKGASSTSSAESSSSSTQSSPSSSSSD